MTEAKIALVTGGGTGIGPRGGAGAGDQRGLRLSSRDGGGSRSTRPWR